MSIQTSNRIQRRQAILRATGLVIFIMILTGFTVNLFPKAYFYEQVGSQDICAANYNALVKMINERNTLQKALTDLEKRYKVILDLDAQWEGTSASGTSATLKRQIDPLENAMGKVVNEIGEQKSDSLSILAAGSYNHLLIARAMIWNLRMANRPPHLPSEGQGQEQEMFILRIKAMETARKLEDEADRLEDAKLKGWFWGKGKKEEAKNLLENVISHLRNLAGVLRNL